jgi:OmpA-OmpF porin, OOP family
LPPLGKKRHIFFSILFSLFIFWCVGDNPFLIDTKLNPKPKRKGKISWIFTGGWNIVDDNGEPFRKLFSARTAWSFPFYPSQISAEIIGDEGLTYGLMFTFNRYKAGKEINNHINSGRSLFFSLDGFAKYHFNEHIAMTKQYDPYFYLGGGYTLRFSAFSASAFTGNFGFGMNYWIDNHWGANIQTLGKLAIKNKFPRNSSNYLHHSFGVVYIIDNTFRKKRSFVKPRYKWIHEDHNVGERRR